MVTQALSPVTTQRPHRARNFADVVAVAVAASSGSGRLGPKAHWRQVGYQIKQYGVRGNVDRIGRSSLLPPPPRGEGWGHGCSGGGRVGPPSLWDMRSALPGLAAYCKTPR
jgi:hypothetical protein